MNRFEIIDDVNNIKLSSDWTDSAKFNSKGRAVGENGNSITSSYKGKQYRLISKKERDFTTAERIGRGFLGVVATVFTLGIAVLFKSVRNLFTQEKMKIRFGVSEHSISEKELQSGVVVSEETTLKIQTCMKNILQRKEEGGVKLYNSQGNHRVFSLDTAPEYIFKMKAYKSCITMGRDDTMKARYQTMINAQVVCQTHQLGLLIIPNAKLFTVEADGEEYEIIAEKKLDLNPSESAQEQYFEEYASSLNETIRQLAVFICKTGYSDVEWRNNPVLNDAPDKFGSRKIGLIDIEEMDSKITGLFGGGLGRRGLVRCVNEEQGKIVESVAKENGVSTSSFASVYARRKKEIDQGDKLKQHYVKHNIVTGSEPLQVDVSALGLDLTEEAEIEEIVRDESGKVVLKDDDCVYQTRKIKFEEVVEGVVKEINKSIQEKPETDSVKGKRYFVLSVNRGLLYSYNQLGLHTGNSYISDEDYENKRWVRRIINALVEKEYLFNLEKVNGHGYFIQA